VFPFQNGYFNEVWVVFGCKD